jgi:hypothetical protein
MDTALHRIEAGIERWRGGLSMRGRLAVLVALTLAAIVATMLAPGMPQPIEYHAFADSRAFLGIPNFADTASNLAFLLVGVWGVLALRRPRPEMFQHPDEAFPYRILFLATALIAAGSAYYHVEPNNETLLWDRLPMVVGFAALIAAMVGERIDRRTTRPVLFLALAWGLGTLIYWWGTERASAGNVTPYAVFQAYSILMAGAIILLFPSRYTRGRELLAGLLFYGFAKVLETYDEAIFAVGGVVSGHTLKHLAAALGLALVVRMLLGRVPRTPDQA